jgi:Uncharacterized protein containing LysM domain
MYSFFVGGILLPVPPSKLSIEINNKNKTVDLINEGEVNILKTAGLSAIKINVTIPQVQYPFARYSSGFLPASSFLKKFEELKANLKPFQFIVTRKMPNGKILFDTNMTVSLEKYTILEDAKDQNDVVVELNFKQYRSYGVKGVTESNGKIMQSGNARTTENSPQPGSPQTYRVVSGDTLWAIAKRFYGNGAKYSKIFDANRNIIKSPDLIFPNQILTIPV